MNTIDYSKYNSGELKKMLKDRNIPSRSKIKSKQSMIEIMKKHDKSSKDLDSLKNHIQSLIDMESTKRSKMKSDITLPTETFQNDHLFDILKYFEENINIISECFEKATVINSYISTKLKSQGGGLASAVFVDLFVTEFLEEKLSSFHTHHDGETDCIILDTSISFKKICPKKSDPSIALDWSKNQTKSEKEYFTDDMMIFSLRELSSRLFKDTIPIGIFFIPKDFCKKYIPLKSNNKTDSLIDKNNLMKMMYYAYEKKLFLPISTSHVSKWVWDISKGFYLKDISQDL